MQVPIICGKNAGAIAVTKTLTFALLHMSVAFTVVYLMTGNAVAGGAVALIEPACNTIAYHFHEKLWARREARRRSPAPDLFAGHA
jgi:uncharacterized membrane protein